MKIPLFVLRKLLILVATIVSVGFTFDTYGDILIGAGQEREPYQLKGPGGVEPPTQVFDFDTATGGRSNIQNFTQRGLASFTAMDRDSSGALWAIHQPNRLVTIDETTGVVTDVVQLSYSPMDFLRFPAMAFVPGSGPNDPDTLFAIANFGRGIIFAPANKDDYPEGFELVTIDLETGAVTQFGMGIGGQYEFDGAGHGLEFDADLGLVHLWNENELQGSPKGAKNHGPSGHIELIDPDTGETTPVLSEYYSMAAPEKRTVEDELPSGFQATVHGDSPGLIYVYESQGDSQSPELFAISIMDNGVDGPTYTSSVVSTFESYSMYGYGPRAKAMERRADGGALIIEIDGILETYEPGRLEYTADKGLNDSGIHVLVSQVETSIGGYAPDFRSLATDPVSGAIFTVSSRASHHSKSASSNKTAIMEVPPLNGLSIIDRNGPANIELNPFHIPLIDPNTEKLQGGGPGTNSPLTEVRAIAFDDRGGLYGIASEGYLVVIDPATGVVTEVETFDSSALGHGANWQLEFNPEDGRFYIFFYDYYEDEPVFASFSRDGSGFAEIALPEEIYGLDPDSMVFAGGGSFFVSDFDSFSNINSSMLKIPAASGSRLFSLSTSGTLSPPQGLVEDIFISALTKLRRIETVQPDVLIGSSDNRLEGDGVYSPDGGGQTISIREKSKRLSGQFSAEVQNDGNSPGVFSITARGGKSSDTVKYFHGGNNVTAAVKGGYPLQLAPGQRASFEAKFSRKDDRKFNEKFRFSAAYGGNVDTGVAKVKIKVPRSVQELKPEDLF